MTANALTHALTSALPAAHTSGQVSPRRVRKAPQPHVGGLNRQVRYQRRVWEFSRSASLYGPRRGVSP